MPRVNIKTRGTDYAILATLAEARLCTECTKG
jgi:hypothetical protein